MSDRMAWEIWIGGKLPRSLFERFSHCRPTTGLGRKSFDATSEEGILAARDESGLLHFADCEAA